MQIRGHTEKYWSKRDRWSEFHDAVTVRPIDNNEYKVFLPFPPSWIGLFTDNINQKVQTLIAPDKRPSRSR
jgi:hypothetical protein